MRPSGYLHGFELPLALTSRRMKGVRGCVAVYPLTSLPANRSLPTFRVEDFHDRIRAESLVTLRSGKILNQFVHRLRIAFPACEPFRLPIGLFLSRHDRGRNRIQFRDPAGRSDQAASAHSW